MIGRTLTRGLDWNIEEGDKIEIISPTYRKPYWTVRIIHNDGFIFEVKASEMVIEYEDGEPIVIYY